MQTSSICSQSDEVIITEQTPIGVLKDIIHKLIDEKAKGIRSGSETIQEMLAIHIKGDFVSLINRSFHYESSEMTREQFVQTIEFLKKLNEEKIRTWRESRRPFAAAMALGFIHAIKEKQEIIQPKPFPTKTTSKKPKPTTTESEFTPEELESTRNIMLGMLQDCANEEKQVKPLPSEQNADGIPSSDKHKNKIKTATTKTDTHCKAKDLLKQNNVVLGGTDGMKIINEEALRQILKLNEQDSALIHEIQEIIRLIRISNDERALNKEREIKLALEREKEQQERKEKAISDSKAMKARIEFGDNSQNTEGRKIKKKEGKEKSKKQRELQQSRPQQPQSQLQPQQSQPVICKKVNLPKMKIPSPLLSPSITFFGRQNATINSTLELQMLARLLSAFMLEDKEKMREFFCLLSEKFPNRIFNCGLNNSLGFFIPEDLPKDYKIPDIVLELMSSHLDIIDPHSLFSMAKKYLEGLGVDVNIEEGTKLMKLAAEKGDVSAQFSYAYLKYTGISKPSNPDELIYWFTQASNNGHLRAEHYLGLFYRHLNNQNEAFQHFYKSCTRGNDESLFFLGLHYYQGLGTAPDLKKAFDYFLCAADKGDMRAQCQVAEWFLQGKGIAKDLMQAKKYLLLAHKTLLGKDKKDQADIAFLNQTINYLGLLFVRGIPIDNIDKIFVFDCVVSFAFSKPSSENDSEDMIAVKKYFERIMRDEEEYSLLMYSISRYLLSKDCMDYKKTGANFLVVAFLRGKDAALNELIKLKTLVLETIPKDGILFTDKDQKAITLQAHLLSVLGFTIYYRQGYMLFFMNLCEGIQFFIDLTKPEIIERLEKIRKEFLDIMDLEYQIKSIVKCAMAEYFEAAVVLLDLALNSNCLDKDNIKKMEQCISFLDKKLASTCRPEQVTLGQREAYKKLKEKFLIKQKEIEATSAPQISDVASTGATSAFGPS